MKIAFLGPRGSFSHHVAQAAFPSQNLVPYQNITEVMKAYEAREVDYSVVPVENSIEGSVHETLDYLFHQADIQAVAEIVQPIKQQLLVTDLEKPIEKIFSHPQAIAPRTAAAEYGLKVAASDIQEMEENYTRFWILGHEVPELQLAKTGDKQTLALTLPDNLPGALYKALSTFAWRGIDLTKIESRPLKTALGEYFFIIDIDNEHKKLADFAYQELTSLGITYKIFGSYSVFLIQDK